MSEINNKNKSESGLNESKRKCMFSPKDVLFGIAMGLLLTMILNANVNIIDSEDKIGLSVFVSKANEEGK
ncbi:hypothetical protein P3646_06865 [Vibrio parahaemolyticus]|nr:hypothetical protein [Vibrio parahaemolyticus]